MRASFGDEECGGMLCVRVMVDREMIVRRPVDAELKDVAWEKETIKYDPPEEEGYAVT
jgi:hypothetical protein